MTFIVNQNKDALIALERITSIRIIHTPNNFHVTAILDTHCAELGKYETKEQAADGIDKMIGRSIELKSFGHGWFTRYICDENSAGGAT